MMKEEKLFQSQGGPIILSQVNLMSTILRFRFEFHKLNMKKKKKKKLNLQIENEYETEDKEFGAAGFAYMNWAAKMAVQMETGVPWVMCKQDDAPDPMVSTNTFQM